MNLSGKKTIKTKIWKEIKSHRQSKAHRCQNRRELIKINE